MRTDGAPRLMILSDAAGDAGAPERWFRQVLEPALAAAEPGSVVVQLRHKEQTGAERFRWAGELRRLTRQCGQRFVVGDRVDIALCVGADGVHLPESAVAVSEARRLLGSQAWISRALHEESLVRVTPHAALETPDAWVVSPVWAPRKGRDARGEALIAQAAAAAKQRAAGQGAPGQGVAAPRVFALGGVTAENAQASLAAGAAGVAVVGAAQTLSGVIELIEALGIRLSGSGLAP